MKTNQITSPLRSSRERPRILASDFNFLITTNITSLRVTSRMHATAIRTGLELCAHHSSSIKSIYGQFRPLSLNWNKLGRTVDVEGSQEVHDQFVLGPIWTVYFWIEHDCLSFPLSSGCEAVNSYAGGGEARLVICTASGERGCRGSDAEEVAKIGGRNEIKGFEVLATLHV